MRRTIHSRNHAYLLQESGERFDIVRRTYAEMHKNQTVQFGKEMVSFVIPQIPTGVTVKICSKLFTNTLFPANTAAEVQWREGQYDHDGGHLHAEQSH
jgi:hypothetical protein